MPSRSIVARVVVLSTGSTLPVQPSGVSGSSTRARRRCVRTVAGAVPAPSRPRIIENVHHAVALDPLTAALLTLEEARAMTDELLAAHAERLPERFQQH